jgi:hypothetical protein
MEDGMNNVGFAVSFSSGGIGKCGKQRKKRKKKAQTTRPVERCRL